MRYMSQVRCGFHSVFKMHILLFWSWRDVTPDRSQPAGIRWKSNLCSRSHQRRGKFIYSGSSHTRRTEKSHGVMSFVKSFNPENLKLLKGSAGKIFKQNSCLLKSGEKTSSIFYRIILKILKLREEAKKVASDKDFWFFNVNYIKFINF